MAMDGEEQKMWEYVHKYLESCAPIRWLDWVSRCGDPDAKKFVESILFRDGRLRDLTNESVRKEILDAIRQTPSIMEIVIRDFADELRKQEENPSAR
jgi:hypothetical protein